MKCGDIFDRKYKILEVLGKGGMGTVYLARNIMLDALWAIKEINKKDNSMIDILIEPNILKRLNHPALPRIFDITEDEENIYIISDYIEGVSLDKELEAKGRFDENKVIEWAEQICDVFAYLHGFDPNPIVYRDMKPSNIILTGQGGVKLIDFGIAREYKGDADNDTVYIGTRGYAAPEQYGCGQTSPASDIYSLGITLHHLLTGKSPNEPPFEVKPVRYYNQNVSENMENIVAKCMRLEPGERYQSALELKNDLKLARADQGGEYIENDIKKRQLSFRRLVLTVWDNAEFACEMAYAAAKMSDMTVILIDLDFSASKVEFYMGMGENRKDLPDSYASKFEKALESIKRGSSDIKAFKQVCHRVHQCRNLYLLLSPKDIKTNERYPAEDMEELLDFAYKAFDLTIVSIGKGIFDGCTRTALKKSDYNMVALRANMDELIEYQNYITYLDREYNIPSGKFRLTAWEYKPSINLPQKLLKKTWGGDCYIGQIKYDSEREKSKNFNCGLYVRTAWKRNGEEYRELLKYFNITPQKTLGEHIKRKLGVLFGKTGEESALNE